MGQEPRVFRTRGEEKRMEIKLHGAIAPPTRHLLKERLMKVRENSTELAGTFT
jgi:hypothetical protein